jgi:hypothetical protein
MHTISLKFWHYWFFAGLVNFLLVILFFFCTVNSLTSFPIDKILLFICPFVIALISPDKILFTSKEFIVFASIVGVAVLSSVMNIVVFPMIFFPAIGFCFSIIVSKNKQLLIYTLYYALLIHIILGIILVVFAFLGIADSYVSMGAKGFAFLYAAHGLTSTVQTYGTLCITWLMLYILRKKLGISTKIDRIFFLINIVAVLLTFNRSTYLFWMLILFFEFPIFFWSILVILTSLLIKFWNVIMLFVLSSASITARSQLLEGFRISYVQSNSWIVYFFGRGNNQISDAIAKSVKWTTRTDIENGYAMLLHTYGIVGLVSYITICICFILMFLKRKRIKEASFLFFYFFVTQYITQEFVSATFYMFLAVMLLTYNFYIDKNAFKFPNNQVIE